MTPAQQIALAADKDRRSIESRGIRAAALLASRLRRTIVSARGGLVSPAAIGTMLRNDFTPLLVDAMVNAHLAGMRRTDINAAPHFRTNIKLAGTVYDEAIEFLRRRAELSESQLFLLRTQYQGPATRIMESATASLEQRLQETVRDSIAGGVTHAKARVALQQAFAAEGFAPQANYRLDAIYRTQTQIAYAAGRNESFADPAVAEILWGFEYVAILDNRTTDLCQRLDGTRREKFDPFWQVYSPPNHWNCRSAAVEIYFSGDETLVPAALPPPQAGFANLPGISTGQFSQRRAA